MTTLQPNERQQHAITAPIAGAYNISGLPGTGKTFVIARRVKYLVDSGVRPDQILVVTAMKRAATEMLERIAALIPAYVTDKTARDQVSSIHAFCFRSLRDDPSTGYKQYAVAAHQWMIKSKLDPIILSLWGANASDDNPGEVPTWREIDAWINSAKLKWIAHSDGDLAAIYYEGLLYKNPGKVAIDDIPAEAIRLANARINFDNDLRAGRSGKRDKPMITYTDMLADWLQFSRRDSHGFLARVQQRITHVIVDEGQDTSGVAMDILTRTASPENNFFIVGDTNQLLMRFAGAAPEQNLLDGFTDQYPDGERIALEINYRSTPEIVSAASQLIAHNYSDSGGDYPQEYLTTMTSHMQLGSDDHQLDTVAVDNSTVTFTAYADHDAEVDDIVAQIAERVELELEHDLHISPADIFIGARTRAQIGRFEGALAAKGIPFVNLSGSSFWLTKHVRILCDYLRVALDPESADGFNTIYNVSSSDFRSRGVYSSTRYLGKAFARSVGGTLASLRQHIDNDMRSSWDNGAEDLLSTVDAIETMLIEHEPDLAILTHVPALGFIVKAVLNDWIAAQDGHTVSDASDNGKAVDLATVIDLALNFDDGHDFLTYVDRAIAVARNPHDRANWSGAVVGGTVHSLKGLERPIIFGVGISEGARDTVGILPHTFTLSVPPVKGRLVTGSQGRVADERCILYVLITRAMRECHLSSVESSLGKPMQPSRFIFEVFVQHDGRDVNTGVSRDETADRMFQIISGGA